MLLPFSRRFARRLEEMTAVALRLSEYDLTQQLTNGRKVAQDGFDRLAFALDRISGNFRQTLAYMRGVAEAMAKIMGSISKSSDVVAHGAQTTFAAVDETWTLLAEVLELLRGTGHSIEVLRTSAGQSGQDSQNLTRTSDQMVANVVELSESVENTSASIEQMTFSIKDVARNVDELSRAAEETSASMSEMAQAIARVENNADETAKLSEQVQTDAEKGVVALEKTLGGIENIRAASLAAGQVFEALRQRALTVGDALNLIEEVSEQTNLLALNAAIIAAQAGQHGRAFAVVADEIKDLATRTSVSTRELAEVVRGIETEAQASFTAMRRGAESVDIGVQLGREAVEALQKIDASARRQADRVREIARASADQTNQSKRVVDSTARIAQNAQQIAHATADQAEGSEQIMTSADRMRTITRGVAQAITDGSTIARRVASSMGHIDTLVKELHAAQAKESLGAEQVMIAVENIKRVAEAHNQATRDLEETLEELRTQSEVLQGEVSRFRV